MSDPSAQATVRDACAGKKVFESYADAHRTLSLIRRRKGRERERSSLNIYRCRFCRGWHIGNYERQK
jgi:hypothetical protein